jgi:DNA-binding MarR family transcriptional regulator
MDGGSSARSARAGEPGGPGEAREVALVARDLVTLAAAIRRAAAAVYRQDFGLGQNEWRIVATLGIEGAMSNNDIAERVALDKGQLSREVSRLVARGLVVRQRVRRSTQIGLSEEGQAIYGRLMTIARRRNRYLLADLGDGDRERLFVLLSLIHARAADLLLHGEEPA